MYNLTVYQVSCFNHQKHNFSHISWTMMKWCALDEDQLKLKRHTLNVIRCVHWIRNNGVLYIHLSNHLGAKKRSNHHCNCYTKPLWLFLSRLRQLLVAIEFPVLLIALSRSCCYRDIQEITERRNISFSADIKSYYEVLNFGNMYFYSAW